MLGVLKGAPAARPRCAAQTLDTDLSRQDLGTYQEGGEGLRSAQWICDWLTRRQRATTVTPSAHPMAVPRREPMSTWPCQIHCAMAAAARPARNVMPPMHKTYCQVERCSNQRLMSFAHPFVSW